MTQAKKPTKVKISTADMTVLDVSIENLSLFTQVTQTEIKEAVEKKVRGWKGLVRAIDRLALHDRLAVECRDEVHELLSNMKESQSIEGRARRTAERAQRRYLETLSIEEITDRAIALGLDCNDYDAQGLIERMVTVTFGEKE